MPTLIRKRAVHRRTAMACVSSASGVPAYATSWRLTRGRCLRRGCRSRWAVVRVTIDLRGTGTPERYAATECADCGRVWRRVRVPALTTPDGYQAVRLTLILPSHARRWYARKRWHVTGEDAVILREANLADLDEAARAQAARDLTAERAKARRKAREAAETAEAMARYRALQERLAAMDADGQVAERLARAREEAM